MQTVHVPRLRLSHGHQDPFRFGLAQDTGEGLQKHLEEHKCQNFIHTYIFVMYIVLYKLLQSKKRQDVADNLREL